MFVLDVKIPSDGEESFPIAASRPIVTLSYADPSFPNGAVSGIPAVLDTGLSVSLFFPVGPACVVLGDINNSASVQSECIETGDASVGNMQEEAMHSAFRKLLHHAGRRKALSFAGGGALRGRLVDARVPGVKLYFENRVIPFSQRHSVEAFSRRKRRVTVEHWLMVERINMQAKMDLVNAMRLVKSRIVLAASPVALHHLPLLSSSAAMLAIVTGRREVQRECDSGANLLSTLSTSSVLRLLRSHPTILQAHTLWTCGITFERSAIATARESIPIHTRDVVVMDSSIRGILVPKEHVGVMRNWICQAVAEHLGLAEQQFGRCVNNGVFHVSHDTFDGHASLCQSSLGFVVLHVLRVSANTQTSRSANTSRTVHALRIPVIDLLLQEGMGSMRTLRLAVDAIQLPEMTSTATQPNVSALHSQAPPGSDHRRRPRNITNRIAMVVGTALFLSNDVVVSLDGSMVGVFIAKPSSTHPSSHISSDPVLSEVRYRSNLLLPLVSLVVLSILFVLWIPKRSARWRQCRKLLSVIGMWCLNHGSKLRERFVGMFELHLQP